MRHLHVSTIARLHRLSAVSPARRNAREKEIHNGHSTYCLLTAICCTGWAIPHLHHVDVQDAHAVWHIAEVDQVCGRPQREALDERWQKLCTQLRAQVRRAAPLQQREARKEQHQRYRRPKNLVQRHLCHHRARTARALRQIVIPPQPFLKTLPSGRSCYSQEDKQSSTASLLPIKLNQGSLTLAEAAAKPRATTLRGRPGRTSLVQTGKHSYPGCCTRRGLLVHARRSQMPRSAPSSTDQTAGNRKLTKRAALHFILETADAVRQSCRHQRCAQVGHLAGRQLRYGV